MTGPRLRVVVAEDEDLSRKRLVRLLQESGCAVVESFSEGRSAMAWLKNNRDVDALFLDIHMPNVDGLAILDAFGGEFSIVLVTAFTEHAIEAFDRDAVDYLLKPVTPSRLERAIKRIESRLGPRPLGAAVPAPAKPMRYPIQAGDGIVLVDLNKTTYFEVDNDVVWAHAGARMRTQWNSLGEVEAAFQGSGMLRIHRHLLVRPEAVIGLKPSAGGRVIVRLMGGDEIEASRGGAPRLRERLGL